MENVKTVTLHAQEVQNDKQKFIACSAQINNNWYKIKFVKECYGAPVSKGLYDLTIDLSECSVEIGKMYTNRNGELVKGNDTIWVKNIAGLRKYTDEELKVINLNKLSEIFGG